MTSRLSIPTTTTTALPTKARVPVVTIEEESGNRGVQQEGEPTTPRATLLWKTKNKKKKKRPSKSPPSASSRPKKRTYTSSVATAALSSSSSCLPRDSNHNVVPVEPEEPPSRFTRRTRRSGGSASAGGGGEDATYMSLQIRYRGGNDWDPLNACWVPKQPKTKKPKTTPEPPLQVQEQQQQQEQHVEKDCHHRDNHDDDDGTAITESSSATEQDSVTLSIQCGSPPTSSAEPRVPRDVQQMEDWFEKAVWVDQIDEKTIAAMTVVVEGDEMESEDNDKNKKVDPATTTAEKMNENGTELSLNTKQPIGNDEEDDEDEDDDEESTTSKRSLLQEEPVPPCLNRPVECPPSVDEASASSHSESSSEPFVPEEPTSDLQVEQPQQENPLLDALFQAVEMAQEMPVDNTEDDTNTSSHVIACDCACAPSVSFSAIDEDIFADAPYDDSINIPVPWCGEDAASKLPRSLLNIYVYGPTPAHMAEIWHKMYGVQC
jgi:hypothetical protein